MQFQKHLSHRALWAATFAFAANFSVWTLYAVLGVEIRSDLDLSATEFGLLLAAPMFTGAIIRWPVGIYVERANGKRFFVWQMVLTLPALLILPSVKTYFEFLLVGLWLGVSGVSFTIGIRYISDWFESKFLGTVMGVFGSGNAGAAVTLLLVPLLMDYMSWRWVGYVYAIGFLLVIVFFAFVAPAPLPYMQEKAKEVEAINPYLDIRIWRFSLYYYFVFGSFLALILWLPQYYMSAYQLSFIQAMNLTLLFTFVSSTVRALGGYYADKYGARTVNWSVFWVCLVCLFFLSYPPTTMTIHGIRGEVNLYLEINVWVFTSLILIIGIAQGFGRASVYKIIHNYYPNHMGQAGGFVSFIGALGGCSLPVLFGLADDLVGVHSACFMLLYGLLAGCMIIMFYANKADEYQQRLKQAIEHNFLEIDD